MRRVVFLIALVAMLAGIACKKSPQTATQGTSPTPSAAAGSPSSQAILVPDDCETMLTVSQAGEILGGPVSVTPQKAQGSLLGGCTYSRTDGESGTLNFSFRPATEYQATVDANKKGEGAKKVEGLGDDAFYASKLGFLVKLPNRQYFLLVYAVGSSRQIDEEMSRKAADQLIQALP